MAESLRNLGIVAHVDAGKTTLSEQLLLLGGAIRQAGRVDEGLATMDYLREEQRRGITIRAGLASFSWKGARINFIDTPGHIDFGLEVERSLRVLDAAILVLCGVRGVEPRTRAIWDLCERFHVPRIAWVNKLDVAGADFAGTVLEMEDAFGIAAIPVDWPIFRSGRFLGAVDLATWTATTESDGHRRRMERVPDDWLEEVAPARDRLLDCASRFDDELTECILAGRPCSPTAIRRGVRKGIRQGLLLPVCGGAALRGWNIDALLDQSILLTPPPMVPDDLQDHPGAGLVFKRVHDEGQPQVCLVRWMAGRIAPGDRVRKPGEDAVDTVQGIHTVFADRLEASLELEAGDIAALELPGRWKAGDTVLLEGSPERRIEFEASSATVLEMAIEGRDEAAARTIGQLLQEWAEEDGGLEIGTEPGTGRWLVRGQGELQLDVLTSRLGEFPDLSFHCGKPHVRHRETLLADVPLEIHDAEWEGRRISLGLAGRPADSCQIEWRGRSAPEGIRAAVEASLHQVATDGVCGGGDLSRIHWQVDLVREDGVPPWLAKKLVDHAAPIALRKAGVAREVPQAKILIHSPLEHVGAITSELKTRGATIQGIDTQRNGAIISALLPLERSLGCSKLLLSLSKGQANTTLMPGGWVAESA